MSLDIIIMYYALFEPPIKVYQCGSHSSGEYQFQEKIGRMSVPRKHAKEIATSHVTFMNTPILQTSLADICGSIVANNKEKPRNLDFNVIHNLKYMSVH